MAQAARREVVELAQGELFADRYQILEGLGRGGMGAVYRARDLSLGEEIALKVLSFGLEPSPTAVLRFRKEVRLARRVTHPNVARVYDIGEHLGKLYLTMELIEGSTLRAVLQSCRRLAPARVVEIARALAAGLAAAHEVGVVHRDLKPSNILIDRSGRVVLSDFGIARSLDDEQSLTTGVVGTPHYMAPEQACGGVIDARVDVYAMGLLLYEMLTGERAEGTPELLSDELRGCGVPKALIVLTLRCIERDPDARPRSTVEVGQRLASLAGADSSATLTLATVAPPLSDTVLAGRVTTPTTLPAPPPEPVVERALAVLPFIYRGGKEHDYLGDVITDELVDVLCRTQRLRVLGTGATSKYREARDPRALGRDLGVFAVIDGTVQMAGLRVRISVRLADADSGVQLWSDHHEGTLDDLFTFQEVIARRVAEELRVEITTLTRRGDAPSEAIEHYLAARRMLRRFESITTLASAAGFERCLELAPGFTPALAGHAIACVRAWFFDVGGDAPMSWEQVSRESVRRALDRAPDLAESHLAAGMLWMQLGEFPAAVRALNKALVIAPTCAPAHEFLGFLECEAGQSDAGVQRLRLALDLDPELSYPLSVLAYFHALHGRNDECAAALTAVEQRGSFSVVLSGITRVRVAAFRGDRATIAELSIDERFPKIPSFQVMRLYAQATLGAFTAAELDARLLRLLGEANNARRLTLAAQLMTEVLSGRGEFDLALLHLQRAADLILIDITWIDRCPLLAPLRLLPAFTEARRRVQARAESLWC